MIEKIVRFLASLLLLYVLIGCATGGVSMNSADFQNNLSSGNIRLTCGVPCALTVGYARPKMKNLYASHSWGELAKEVANVGYDNDQQYYYLAVSAAYLGYKNAARTYIALSNASRVKCGVLPNSCDGLSFPADANALLVAINNAEARDAAARSAAARAAQQKQQQQSAPTKKPNNSQADVANQLGL